MSRVAVVAVVLVGVALTQAPALLRNTHLAPPMTFDSLPPAILYWPLIAFIDLLESIVRNVTPPNLYLFRNVMGFIHTSQLYTLAELRVADHLAAGPLSSAALARAVAPSCAASPEDPASCDAVALRLTRLLRATAAYGVFREAPGPGPDGGSRIFEHTASSVFLRADHPYTLRASALNFGGVEFAQMEHLPETVLTGVASFRLRHGDEFWSWFEAHPDKHKIFDDTMRELGQTGGQDLAIATDFAWGGNGGKGGEVLVDVGGGQGVLLRSILRQHPAIAQGIVFDLPSVTSRPGNNRAWVEAASTPEGAALLARASWVPGDMFNPATVPSAATNLAAAAAGGKLTAPACAAAADGRRWTYALRDIVHDWADEDVVRILTSLREVLRDTSTALCAEPGNDKVIRRPVPAGAAPPPADRVALVARIIKPGTGFIESQGSNDADVLMLSGFGTTAGERTLPHFDALFARSGLRRTSVTSIRGYYYVIIAEPVPGWAPAATSA